MQKIRIITDSACDIPRETAERLDIRVLPIPITHEGKSYRETIDFTNEEFYELLQNSKSIPSTSHITSNIYLDEYKKAYEEGCTHVLNVTINSKGSSMYDSSLLAKQMFYDELSEDARDFVIEVVDSKTYTIAYGIAVIEAAKMSEAGKPFYEIIDMLKDWFDRVEICFSVYSLDQVKKSGRVSCAAAFVGELLGLRPIILFVDGEAKIVDKTRGDRNVLPKLMAKVKERMKGTDHFCVAGGNKVEETKDFAKLAENELHIKIGEIYKIGASISINSGPTAVAAVYAGEKRQ